jgi:hypothetical protein
MKQTYLSSGIHQKSKMTDFNRPVDFSRMCFSKGVEFENHP